MFPQSPRQVKRPEPLRRTAPGRPQASGAAPLVRPRPRPRALGGTGLLAALVALLAAGCTEPEPEPAIPSTELVCDRDYAPALSQLVEEAEEEILIAQWEFFEGSATDDVLDLLEEAADRGIQIRVLLDDALEENVEAVGWLEAVGVDARLDGSDDDKVHAKLVLADGDTAIVGSTNWSTAAIDYNAECNLLIRSDEAVSYLDAWFEGLWDHPEQRRSPDLGQAPEAETKALVDDDLLETLLELIDGAEQRIDFTLYATYLQPSNPSSPAMQVFSSLTQAAGRGVEVRGVADWSDWNPDNNETNAQAVDWLELRGVSMRWDVPGTNMHAKSFLVDQRLQVQSANISSSGLSYNHEAGALTRSEEVVSDFEDWFEALWAASTENGP